MKKCVLAGASLVLASCVSTAPPAQKSIGSAGGDEAQAKPRCVEEEFDVYFELGATDLTPEATLVLQRVGQRYAECELSIITIEGHADSDGPEQINMEISRQRAEAVGDVLLDMNIETERLRLVPLGESRALNSDGEKRPLNRKTVVRIVP